MGSIGNVMQFKLEPGAYSGESGSDSFSIALESSLASISIS